MTEPVPLRTDGPHSPEYTQQVADTLAECARVLNYATLGDAPGLEYPGDVYSLLGALYTATERLPQLFGQLARFMRAQADTGRLADSGHPDAGPWARVVARDLESIAPLCESLTYQLQQRQNDLSGLYVKEDDGCPEPE